MNSMVLHTLEDGWKRYGPGVMKTWPYFLTLPEFSSAIIPQSNCHSERSEESIFQSSPKAIP